MLSTNYCRTPGPPRPEKQLSSGDWVLAYDVLTLDCLHDPPRRLT